MADKTTHAGGVTLRGIVEPAEARERARAYWAGQLARAQEQLARNEPSMPVSYWQGTRRIHPDCEERPAVTVPTPTGATPLGHDRGLLIEAAEAVIDAQVASPSYLQRKIRVGVAKAGRLMQLLEERGIVARSEDNRHAFKVLVAPENRRQAIAAIESEDAHG